MKTLVAYCLCYAFCFLAGPSAVSAQETYDLYLYRPLHVGMRWTYQGTSLKEAVQSTREITTEVLRKETFASCEVKVIKHPSGWFDFYEESEEGIKRRKDENPKLKQYGTYDPPAIQYPRYMKMGELYQRVSTRKEFNAENNALLETKKEYLEFILLGKEDIKVPAGKFKDCLKTLADYRTFNSKNEEVSRKIILSWSALDVGIVKVIAMKLWPHEIVTLDSAELKAIAGGPKKKRAK
jgi:hypothetical protein